MTPGYLAMAEFHDLFMDGPWDRLTPVLRETFGNLPGRAVVADFGAGSGLGTRRLASQTPARIVALEPDLVMRSILLARVADDGALAERVSVVAGSLPSELHLLPPRIDGFIAMHMLGHLSPLERLDLFTWVESHLAPEGVGVVTVSRDEPEASDSPSEVVETRCLGMHDYRAIHRSHPEPDTYSSRYEVWEGDVLLRSAEFAGSWQPVSFAGLSDELVPLALRVTELHPGLVTITRQGHA